MLSATFHMICFSFAGVRKIIGIFLILVMSIQLLPVQEVGKLLWGQTMTEEIPAHEIHVKGSPAVQTEPPNFLDFLHSQLDANIKLAKLYYSFDENAYSLHHLEVLLQPPNFC